MKPFGGTLTIRPRAGSVELVHALDGDEKVLATFWEWVDPDRPDPDVFTRWVRERLYSMDTEAELRAERDDLYARLLRTEADLSKCEDARSDLLLEMDRMIGDTCPITGNTCDRGCPDVDNVYCEREDE